VNADAADVVGLAQVHLPPWIVVSAVETVLVVKDITCPAVDGFAGLTSLRQAPAAAAGGLFVESHIH
jgi:hypothetical protein